MVCTLALGHSMCQKHETRGRRAPSLTTTNTSVVALSLSMWGSMSELLEIFGPAGVTCDSSAHSLHSSILASLGLRLDASLQSSRSETKDWWMTWNSLEMNSPRTLDPISPTAGFLFNSLDCNPPQLFSTASREEQAAALDSHQDSPSTNTR